MLAVNTCSGRVWTSRAAMNPALPIIAGITLLLSGCRKGEDQSSGHSPAAPNAPAQSERLQRMANAVSELKNSTDKSKAGQQVGALWIQAGHLKREGGDTKNVEGLLSDLEWNLRSSQQDVGARRRLANELDYEIEILKRRNR
jgi:hypothetical protein